MSLQEAIDRYIEWQRSHGAKFETSAGTLLRFGKGIGGEIACDAVTPSQVLAYLAGNGPLTRYRENKYGALAGFYRYAISRGYASSSPLPLPDNEPKPPRSRPPYIYSHEELRRLFGAIEESQPYAVQLDRPTLRTLLLLLYGAALRGGEARALTGDDVDLSAAVLTVRNAKFYKSRLVPVSSQLTQQLRRLRGASCKASPSAGSGVRLPGESGWNAAAQGYGLQRLRKAAAPRRDRVNGRLAASPATAFAPPQLRGSSVDGLVPPGRRCATPVAGALDLSRPRQVAPHPGLPVHDAGAAAPGGAAVRALHGRRQR